MMTSTDVKNLEAKIAASISNMHDSKLITALQVDIWREIARSNEPINICQCWVLLSGRLRVPALKQELSKMLSMGVVSCEQDLVGISYYKAVFV